MDTGENVLNLARLLVYWLVHSSSRRDGDWEGGNLDRCKLQFITEHENHVQYPSNNISIALVHMTVSKF